MKWFASLLVVLLVGCAPVSQEPPTLEGVVTIRGEPRQLPEGATMNVQLQDVSLMDAAATRISQVSLPITGSGPYQFSLPYPQTLIQADRRYGIRVTIVADRRLVYISTDHIDAFAGSPIQVALSEVARQSMGTKPRASLTGTYWRAIDIRDVPVDTLGAEKEIHLKLASDRVSGSTGCNRFFGDYSASDDALSFGQLGATLMACMDGMRAEKMFLDALTDTSRYAIHGDIMTLYAGDQAVARFEAVYLQ